MFINSFTTTTLWRNTIILLILWVREHSAANHLFKVTQLVNGKVRTWTQAVWLQSMCSLIFYNRGWWTPPWGRILLDASYCKYIYWDTLTQSHIHTDFVLLFYIYIHLPIRGMEVQKFPQWKKSYKLPNLTRYSFPLSKVNATPVSTCF